MKEHKISLGSAILMNMNIMIGSGILVGPALIATVSGNASFLAWPLVALLFLPMVLCTARLSKMFPGCGGFYSYAKEGLNVTAGYFSGLLYILGYTFAAAIEVLAFRSVLLKTIGENWFLNNEMLFNVVCLLSFVALNLISFKLFSKILGSLTITKILPLVVLIALLPFIFNPTFTVTSAELFALPMSLPFAIFGYFGFEYCCSITHLIEDSEKNGPRATVLGFLGTAALYMLFHFGLLNLMGAMQLSLSGVSSFAEFIDLPIPFLKPVLLFLIPLSSLLTLFAAANGILNSNIIMMHSMAVERLFLFSSTVTKVNRNQRPWVALVLQAFIILGIVTFVADISTVGNLCNLSVFLSFVLPFVSLWLIQKKRGMNKALPLTMLGLAVVFGFVVYSWYCLGDTVALRCTRMMPLLVILAVGYLLFLLGGKGKAQKPEDNELLYH